MAQREVRVAQILLARRGPRQASAARRRRPQASARQRASSVPGPAAARAARTGRARRSPPRSGARSRRACRRPCRRGTASCTRRAGRARPRRRPCTRGTRRTAPGARRSTASARRRRRRARPRAPSCRARPRPSAPSIVEVHASPSSSGKCSSRLRIGAGMPPPCAHSEPSSSVSSSASSLTRSTGASPFEHLVRAAQADPAGEALPAALVGAEAQQVRGERAHVGRLVEADDPAVAEHAADRVEVLEVERRVEQRRRQDPAERPADLQRLERVAVAQAAREVLAELAHRHRRTRPRRRPARRSAR